MERRAAVLSRLFQGAHVGVYIGTIHRGRSSTIAANPHLKLIFGYDSHVDEADVRPFDQERFLDAQSRDAWFERLATDGTVSNYLLRLRRVDDTAIWIEMTGRAEAADRGGLRLEAILRDVSERKKL